MTRDMKNRLDGLSNWGAIAYLVIIFLGWGVVAGFLLPPTPPSASAEEVTALYQANPTGIRIGMVMVMFSALAMLPFTGVMGKLIAKVEGGAGTLTYLFLLGAVGNMVLSFYPAIWYLTAAFRLDRAPELIYLMNDLAWLQLIGGVTMYLAMPLAVFLASLCDDSAEPLIPRWAGYACAWSVVMVLPDQLLFFFHSGPFAWNGLLGLWVPVIAFGAFFIVGFVVVRRAIQRGLLNT